MYKFTFTVLLLVVFNTIAFQQTINSKEELINSLSGQKSNTEKVKIYNQLAFLYLYEEQNDSALYYAGKAFELAPGVGNEEYLADTYNLLGIIYRQLSDNERAVDFLLKGLRLYEKNKLYKKAARTLGNISGVFSDQQQQDVALEYLFKAVTYSRYAGDSVTLVSLYGNIFWGYLQKKDFKKANEYFALTNNTFKNLSSRKDLNPREKMDIEYQRSKLNYLKANLKSAEGDFKEAISIYLEDLKTSGNDLGIESKIDIFMGLSENYYLLKQYDLAIVYTDSILTALQTDSIPYQYMDTYKKRAKIFATMKSFENAYKEQVLFKTISDSVLNSDSRKSTANLKIAYETEKKEQQIAQLDRDKKNQKLIIFLSIAAFVIAIGMLLSVYRSRKLQQKLFSQKAELLQKKSEVETGQLRAQMTELEQKALRAQMNPHFIFNSLNSVQHFVMNKDVEGVNKYLAAFAHLIRQTLNNSGKPVISLDEEVKYLDTYLSLEKMKSNDRFSYTINVDEQIDRSATFIPGMILQPFVENSIRHGVSAKEKNDGHIRIHISKNGKLVCHIEDNGIGREKAGEIKRLSADTGYESKGLDITRNRIETINKMYDSSISVNISDLKDKNGMPAGTSVDIEFPPDLE